jgi:amidohydrolase
MVAEHLTQLGMEVKTGVGKTGVVGILRGTSNEPVVALRAEMDALPITERADLPFASKVRDTWEGKETGVMYACGHDNNTAMLMGAAEVLAKARNRLPGTVKFIFQPAEELAAGASAMIKDGALENPAPEAIFGVHVLNEPTGTINYRAGYFQSSGKIVTIDVHGVGGHGAWPWKAVNPVVVASQIVLGLQTILSNQIDIYGNPCVVDVTGLVSGDGRGFEVPEKATIKVDTRFFSPEVGQDLMQRIEKTATSIAEGAGARAEISLLHGPPPVLNDPELTRLMTPTLARVAGKSMVRSDYPPSPGADDFASFVQDIPGMYMYLGAHAEGAAGPSLHSPDIVFDEKALIVGVRALSNLAVDYLVMKCQAH